MKKVELLAPAGNFTALKGAILAGADAVYLGGSLYGARAYAENFTQDEICQGIHLAHVFGRKIYLTVNTLVKEKELDGLYDFLLPFYEAGLDGVIVQDLGVFRYIRTHFPGLSLHASTQMTLTGSKGAAFLKAQGASRIVPARELSLSEIKKIKSTVDVEIEAFVHGAMCYCYSGQCLFSSMLGGRSGNRGRCAQPCRLPYEIEGKEACYPLSMRDMCTISLLPELVEAGIDSFKIEGRMKKPAYAAGVTAIYRKYLDLYETDKENYQVSEADLALLKKLYIRSEIGEGYYHRQNGREMITLTSPAYSATDEALLAEIGRKYLDRDIFHQVAAKAYFEPGKAAELTLYQEKTSVLVKGAVVQKALKQPLREDKIIAQIKKSGNSLVKIDPVTVESKDEIFLPVSALNELRRKAAEAFEQEMIRRNQLDDTERGAVLPKPYAVQKAGSGAGKDIWPALHAVVRTKAQLNGALQSAVKRIYIDYSLLDQELLKELKACRERGRFCGSFFLCTPYIVREKNHAQLAKIKELLATDLLEGVLVRNLESFQFFAEQLSPKQIVLDANLYLWNREAVSFWEGRAGEFYLPVECHYHEWSELLAHCPQRTLKASVIVYGRLPMMITANCLRKTKGACGEGLQSLWLKDRYEKKFPVYTDCLSCYNIIYNSVPLSLHKLFEKNPIADGGCRLDFTTEDLEETRKVLRYFEGIAQGKQMPFFREYTTGHLKRGVE